jgi:hypothetical protein
MLVVAGLRYKNAVGSCPEFDEVMTANIYHDLRTGIYLSVQLLLQLLDSLSLTQSASRYPYKI